MLFALETEHLSKRYGRKWALQKCTLHVPTGSITGLVGPNGAGKTTLLHLAMGLLAPTSGRVSILGYSSEKDMRLVLAKIGFVAQDHPLYKTFRVEEMLTLGRKLNPQWDQDLAVKQLAHLNIPLRQKTGSLSGGQQAQVALILALAKRPEVLFLDEPAASLDPLARHAFYQTLRNSAKEQQLSVVISSHNVAELEQLCDYLVILSASHVQLTDHVEHLLQSHKVLFGPPDHTQMGTNTLSIVASEKDEHQCRLLVREHSSTIYTGWQVQRASLEDIILAYLSHPDLGEVEAETVKMEVLQ